MPKEAPQSLYDVTAGRAEQKLCDRLCEERGISTARLKSIQYSVWWAAQSKTLASFHLLEKKGEMCGKPLPCRNPNGLGIVMMNTEAQSQRGCSSAHEILRASCHPNLCRFYGDIKSLRLMNLLQPGYLRYLKFRSAHVMQSGLN